MSTVLVSKAYVLLRINYYQKDFQPSKLGHLPLLLKTLVRLHLEYGNTLWHLHFKERVDKVHWRTTKLVHNVSDLPYQQRLKILNMDSLFYRRGRSMIMVHEMVLVGMVKIDPNHFSTDKYTVTRGDSLKVFKGRSRPDVTKKIFRNQVVEDWKILPQ